MGTQQVRIDKTIADLDLLDLDPQLSMALQAYPHADLPATAPSFAPFQAAPPAGGSSPAPAPVQAVHSGAAAQQAQQAGLETAGSSTAAGQGAAAVQPSPRSPADPAAAQQKWDAFSAHSNQCLLSAPSPFDSPAPAPAPMRFSARPLQLSATFDVAQLAALRQQAAAAAAAAAQGQHGPGLSPQLQPQPQSAPVPELAGGSPGSYGSFKLAEQPSALPLVLQSDRQHTGGSSSGGGGEGSGSGQASGSPPRKGFLGMFRRSATPEQQASGGQAAGSDLIQAGWGWLLLGLAWASVQ